jgi:hypothetical protein
MNPVKYLVMFFSPGRVRVFLQAFFLLFLGVTGPFMIARGQSPRFAVCNKGKIDLKVAAMTAKDGIFSDSMTLEAWYIIGPSECEWVSDYIADYTYLVFGIDGPNGEFGVIDYNQRDQWLARTKRGLRELCVKADKIHESSWSTNNYGGFVPPCPSGYTAVPISYSLFGVGNRSGDFTLNVTPPIDGYQHYSVILREGKKPVIPEMNPSNSTPIRSRGGVTVNKRSSTAKKAGGVSSWALPPLVSGNWLAVGPEVTNNLRATLVKSSPEMAALGRRITQFRTRQLSFYPGARLYEGQLPASATEVAGVCSFIVLKDGTITPLNGKSVPIHQLNARVPIGLRTNQDVESYLRFFSSETFGDDGSFRIVDTLEDISWARNVSDSQRQIAAGRIMQLTLSKLAPGKWQATATVQYGDTLFESVFTIRDNGVVDMIKDKPLVGNLDVRHEAFTGLVRHEVRKRK